MEECLYIIHCTVEDKPTPTFFLIYSVFPLLGFVQGKVSGPSLDSSPYLSDWQAMRPVVLCDDDVMTFTASGEGFTHLLVDRGETFGSSNDIELNMYRWGGAV